MKKRILLIIAIVAMLACTLAISVSAAEYVDENGLKYVTNSDGTARLVDNRTAFTGTEAIVKEKITVEGVEYTVTTIDKDVFYGLTNLETIYFPSTITRINGYTYCGCSGLKNVYVNFENLVVIGERGLTTCTSSNSDSGTRKDINFYDPSEYGKENPQTVVTANFKNITSIGDAAMQGLNVENLILGENLSNMPKQSFRHSTISTLKIETTKPTTFCHYAFNACLNLKTIEIMAAPTKVENDFFSQCKAVESIKIDLSKCTLVGGSAFEFSTGCQGSGVNNVAVWYNLEGENIVDLSSCKTINSEAFGTSNIGSATIIWPTALESLADQAFRKANITGPMLINAAEGKTLNLPYWCFNGNNPSILICNEGVTSVDINVNGTTAVFLAPSIKITNSNGAFRNGSTLYCYSLAEDSKVPDPNHCTTVNITSGTINNYGACGVVANLVTEGGNVTVGEAVHTTSDAIDNSLCPVGQVTVTSCKYCDYEAYFVGGVATEKKEHDYSLVGSISYNNFYEMGYKTTKCVCGAEMESDVATEAAIFTLKGISFSEYKDANGNYSATQGYEINQEAYNAYINSGKTLVYGFVASVAGVTGTQPLKVENGDVCAVNEGKTIIVDQGKIAHNYFDIKISGFKAENNGVELVMCLFTFDGEGVNYLNKITEENQATSADTVTINIAE